MTTSMFKLRSKFTACVLACAMVLSVAAYARGGGGGGGFHGGVGFHGGGFHAASAGDTLVVVAPSPRALILPRTASTPSATLAPRWAQLQRPGPPHLRRGRST